MLSIGQKIQRISGLADTPDANPRTSEFITDMVRLTENGKRTGQLSSAQVDWIERIHARHFGGEG